MQDLLDAAFARLRRSGGAVLAGGVLLQLPANLGCVDGVDVESAEQADWAQYEGIRDTSMVRFTGDVWSSCRQPNTRFGCGSIDIFLKLRVRPVANADINWKRVGVVWKAPGETTERTAIGSYFATYADGDEEWHVPVNVATWQTTVLFDAWYQDGAGTTWIDDNQGELHVASDGPSYNVVRVEPWLSGATHVSVQLSDLDFDKQVLLVGTTDGWATKFELPMAWAEDFAWSPGRERWAIDVDLPDGAEYAVVYRHGVINGARTYEFWDNNFGANYRVTRTVD